MEGSVSFKLKADIFSVLKSVVSAAPLEQRCRNNAKDGNRWIDYCHPSVSLIAGVVLGQWICVVDECKSLM